MTDFISTMKETMPCFYYVGDKVSMKPIRTKYPGWDKHPVYHVATIIYYRQIEDWMYRNDCDPFLLKSGGNGYTFQVRKNHEWFILRWL